MPSFNPKNNPLNQKFVRILSDRENAIWQVQGCVSPGFFLCQRLWADEIANPERTEVLAARDLANYPISDTLEAAKESV